MKRQSTSKVAPIFEDYNPLSPIQSALRTRPSGRKSVMGFCTKDTTKTDQKLLSIDYQTGNQNASPQLQFGDTPRTPPQRGAKDARDAREQPYSYPVKDEELSFINRFYSEKMTGPGLLPTAKQTSFCSLMSFLFYGIFGLIFFVIAQDIKEIRVRYDDICANQTMCIVNITLHEDVQAPFFLYYELDQFYSNHKYYVDSLQGKQMSGGQISLKSQQTYCLDAQINRDMPHGNLSALISGTGYVLDDLKPANPCGVAAKYIFNDSFLLNGPAKDESVFMNQTGITYFVDREYKFSRNKFFPFLQWLDTNNQHVMNWLGIQTLPYMIKLWARIDANLDKGSYQMLIYNNYQTQIFKGTKTLILSTSSDLGTKNLVFGQILLSISGFYLGAFCYISIRNCRKQQQKNNRVQQQPLSQIEDFSPVRKLSNISSLEITNLNMTERKLKSPKRKDE